MNSEDRRVTVALGIEYDGKPFHGFQRQANVRSVQADLETAISTVADEPVQVVAAGRTDTGVHATQQVVSFATHAERSADGWRRGVTSLTSDAIGVVWADPTVDVGFHARFSAFSRRYCYVIVDRGDVLVLGRDACVPTEPLDVDRMHRTAQSLLGEHDFTSFRAAGCQSRTASRNVMAVSVRRRSGCVVLEIEANAFLLHMVRNIAGGLMAVGRGRMSEAEFVELRDVRDRRLAPPTAPPQGLYLVHVGYPELDLEPRYPFFLHAL